MKITKVKITNFRLLENVEINIDETTTSIVGKNKMLIRFFEHNYIVSVKFYSVHS
jgi:hypothetical protein